MKLMTILPKLSLTAAPPVFRIDLPIMRLLRSVSHRCRQITLVAASFAVLMFSLISTSNAQTLTANRVNISNTTGATVMNFNVDSTADSDFSIFVNENFFDIDTFSGLQAFKVTRAAQSHSLRVEGTGIGIGLGASGTPPISAPLHVLGGGASPFANARILVEDVNASEGLRELLRLKNNGGSAIHFEDTSAFDGHFKLENVIGGFEIANVNRGAVNLRISSSASANLLNLVEGGVGIGTTAPNGTIHVLADGTSSSLETANLVLEVTDDLPERTRNMVQLINNGPVVQTFTDTSTTDPGIYQISAASDRFSIQQFNNNRAGMVMFADGAIRFVANAQPNFTVTGTGTLNVVGSGVGGGNMNVGVGVNIGPNDGNLFVKRDITYGGTLNGPSDVNIKENFQEIDPKEILRKVANLPITRWNYITDDNKTPHVGPMAQDFRAAFKVGSSEKHISMMDSDGVSLAAIKGLSQIVEERDVTIEKQADEIAKLKLQLKEQADAIAAQDDAISNLTEGLERLELLVAPAQK